MNKLTAWIITGIIVVGIGATVVGVLIANRSSNNKLASTTSSSTTATISTDEPLQTQQQITLKDCLADTCLRVPDLSYPVASLPSSVQTALSQSLDNEYKMQSYYQAVIDTLGSQRPFAMIIGAETQHVAVINSLYEKYGLKLEPNQWANKTYNITTLTNACQTAAGYERDTVNLYNALLPQVANYPDISQVFTNINDAAKTSHLPAFEKCS